VVAELLPAVELQVLAEGEGDLVLAQQPQRPAFRDRREAARDSVHVDGGRLLALSPSRTALSLPCPGPVRPSEPYRATRTVATCGSRPSSRKPLANIPAAFIGPTVCELDGPMPTLNSRRR
jgi:hypothetical protein